MSFFRPVLPFTKASMNANDLRQCLRIAFGGMLGLLTCKLLELDYGAFFVVYPILLLGMVPQISLYLVNQFFASMVMVSFAVLFVQGFFGAKPVPMTIIVILLFAALFRQMSLGRHFLFSAISIVSLSMQFHFASYDGADVEKIVILSAAAVTLSIIIASLMHMVFPDVEPRQPRQLPQKSAAHIRHETILTTTVATLSFIAFQIMDLQGSLSAQVATILVLFPLNWKGASVAGWNRALGTLVGCNVGLLMQLILLTHFDVLLFIVLLFWVCAFFFARIHMLEGGISGTGFGALTTLATLFGQYLAPQRDLVLDAVYRFSSLAVAVTLSLMVIYLMHHLLNRFEVTRLPE